MCENEIMLDLETAGNGSNAAIIAIGAVAFNFTDGVIDKFYTEVSLETSVDAGGVIDASTFVWWLKQSENARGAFENNERALGIASALRVFSNWYTKHNGRNVWGNGAVFDNVVLSNAYKNAGLERPWTYWQDRCYRTMKSFRPDIKLKRVGTHHNAVDDAESQALHLIEILNKQKQG